VHELAVGCDDLDRLEAQAGGAQAPEFQPSPPLSRKPLRPTEGQCPTGKARPRSASAPASYELVTAGCTAAVRAASSTASLRNDERSISKVPSRSGDPTQLWPPARTATWRRRERASSTAATTSDSEAALTIASGKRAGFRAFQSVSFEQLEEPAALRRIRSGDLDLAVVWRIPGFPGLGGDTRDESFDQLHLVDDPYRVVLPPKHRLARRSQVRLADLADERFTAPAAAGHALPYREMLAHLCAKAGFEPRIHQVEDVTVGRAIIAAGLSVGLLSELTMPEPRPDIALRPPRDISPYRSIHATWLRGRRVPAVSRMVRYLAEAAQSRLGGGGPAGADPPPGPEGLGDRRVVRHAAEA
jgi:LysR substrate binding domain